jgi:hypothetical protein
MVRITITSEALANVASRGFHNPSLRITLKRGVPQGCLCTGPVGDMETMMVPYISVTVVDREINDPDYVGVRSENGIRIYLEKELERVARLKGLELKVSCISQRDSAALTVDGYVGADLLSAAKLQEREK